MIEMVEIKAGDIAVKVPNTPEGITVFKATLKLLEAVFGEEEKHTETQLTGKEKGQHKEKLQAVSATPSFSIPVSSPKQRIKFRGWEPIGKSSAGIIYKEVVNRILEEYKDGNEPKQMVIFKVIREMYGEHLAKSSIISYASVYKRYIRENELAMESSAKEPKSEDIKKPVVKHSQIEYNPKGKYLLPIKKVLEIWHKLPDEFEYKQVKALVPAYITQSGPRIDTAKFIIKQFLEIAEFGCEETTPGVFKKENE